MAVTAMYDVMGPRAESRVRNFTVIGGLVIAALIIGVLWQLGSRGLLSTEVWSILVNQDFASLMIDGALATLAVAIVSIILSFLGGLVLALLALSDNKILTSIVRIWVEIFRGVPLMVLIFFAYLGLPSVGIILSPFWALTLSIVLYNSAVMSEIVRSGVKALPAGQSEAALALGFRKMRMMLVVVLPQAIKIMLPALISQMVIVLKESSLGFVIGYGELLRNGRIVVDYAGTIHAIPVYLTIALVYLSMNISLSKLARYIQSRNIRE